MGAWVFQCVLTTFLCWQCTVCGRSGLHGVCAPSPVAGVIAPEPESAHHLNMVVGAVMAQRLRVNSVTSPFAQVCPHFFLSLLIDVLPLNFWSLLLSSGPYLQSFFSVKINDHSTSFGCTCTCHMITKETGFLKNPAMCFIIVRLCASNILQSVNFCYYSCQICMTKASQLACSIKT